MIVRDNYLICCSHGNFGTEPGVVKVYDLLVCVALASASLLTQFLQRQDWVLLYKGHELYITDIAINVGVSAAVHGLNSFFFFAAYWINVLDSHQQRR
jgi:hypothetical protein